MKEITEIFERDKTNLFQNKKIENQDDRSIKFAIKLPDNRFVDIQCKKNNTFRELLAAILLKYPHLFEAPSFSRRCSLEFATTEEVIEENICVGEIEFVANYPFHEGCPILVLKGSKVRNKSLKTFSYSADCLPKTRSTIGSEFSSSISLKKGRLGKFFRTKKKSVDCSITSDPSMEDLMNVAKNSPQTTSVEAWKPAQEFNKLPNPMSEIKYVKALPVSIQIHFPSLFFPNSEFTDCEIILDCGGSKTVLELKDALWQQISEMGEMGEMSSSKYHFYYYNKKNDLVEIVEEIQPLYTISGINEFGAGSLPAFEVRPANKEFKTDKDVAKKIAFLLEEKSQQLEVNDDKEIIYARRALFNIRYNIEAKDSLSSLRFQAEISEDHSLLDQEEYFPLNLYLDTNVMIPARVKWSHTPAIVLKELAREIRKRHPESRLSEFILKAPGYTEYLDLDTSFLHFKRTRQQYLDNGVVDLLVCKKEFSDSDSNDFIEMTLMEDVKSVKYHYPYHTTEGRQSEMKLLDFIPLFDINRNFRLKIIHLSDFDYDEFDNIVLQANIVSNGVNIVIPVTNRPNTITELLIWNSWIVFDIPVRDLPRTAILKFVIYGKSINKSRNNTGIDDATVLACCSVTILDFLGILKQGTYLLPMFKKFCGINCRSNESKPPTLKVSFDEYFVDDVELKTRSRLNVFHPGIDIEKELLRNNPPIFSLREEDLDNLKKKIHLSSCDSLTAEEKIFIWNSRYHFVLDSKALYIILACAKPSTLELNIEIKKLLNIWEPPSYKEALRLLDHPFTDIEIREYAVKHLEVMKDSELQPLLPQLIQALALEPYLDSALGRFLLRRALENQIGVGHYFYWHLKAEQNSANSLVITLLLEAYLRGCESHMDDLFTQTKLIGNITSLAKQIKNANPNERKEMLQFSLANYEFPPKMHLTICPRYEATGMVKSDCKIMGSKKLPLYCVFESSHKIIEPFHVIFKVGDDLRQDILCIQILRFMDKWWKSEGLDLSLTIYECISTDIQSGIIEVVKNAETVSNIQRSFGGSRAAFKDTVMMDWLKKHNPEEKNYNIAVDNFARSCAGYCVATYVLGIGDRHNDNIMVTKLGKLFHIDFGHFLGNIKKKFGIRREWAPFVLTPDFVFVMGKKEGSHFKQFTDYCIQAYLIVRRNSSFLFTLFSMMLNTGLEELDSVEALEYLKHSLSLHLNEEEAAEEFKNLINVSLKLGWSTQINWWIHNLSQSTK